jgi:hypothetical protein
MWKSTIAVAWVIMLFAACCAVAYAQSGPVSSAATKQAQAAEVQGPWWPEAPLKLTWFCGPPPNLPAPAQYTCGTGSSPAYCIGKTWNSVCGVQGGYCAYCWQTLGPPDDLGNLPCTCRN